MIGCHKGTGCIELVEINDIQLESCTTFGQSPMEATTTMREEPIAAMRPWLSLIQGDATGTPKACSEDKEFSAKSGEDFCLNYCYQI